MKLLFIPLIMFHFFAQAQPFIGLGIGNKGASGIAGLQAENVQLQLSYQVPFLSAETPTVTALSAGYAIGSDWSITPLVGMAWTTRKDFTEYDKGGEIITTSVLKPMYGFEAGYAQHIGKAFIAVNNFGYGAGIKFIFK